MGSLQAGPGFGPDCECLQRRRKPGLLVDKEAFRRVLGRGKVSIDSIKYKVRALEHTLQHLFSRAGGAAGPTCL